MAKVVIIFMALNVAMLAFLVMGLCYLEMTTTASRRSCNDLPVLTKSREMAPPTSINATSSVRLSSTSIYASASVRQEKKQNLQGCSKTTGLQLSNKQFCLTIRARGQLGNMMFKYASSRGIAHAQDRKLVLPPLFKLSKTFNIKNLEITMDTSGWPVIIQRKFTYFDSSLMALPPCDVMIESYLQSYKYFESIQDEIKQEFTFSEAINKTANDILENITSLHKEATLIGVHVRRGDFMDSMDLGFVVPEQSYFIKAFEWMKKEIPNKNIVFLVVSNDIEWCETALTGNDVIILQMARAPVHLALLTKCNHVIISGGTFGWWGSWLAGGRVVYFSDYMNNNTLHGKMFIKEDYYPPDWVGLGN